MYRTSLLPLSCKIFNIFTPFRMTDNSDIVFRWEIGNAAARFAAGRLESEAFYGGGFKWVAAIERCSNMANFALRCSSDFNGSWKCDATVEVDRLRYKTRASDWFKGSFCFNENSRQWLHKSDQDWEGLTNPMYRAFDKITFELRIKINKPIRCEMNTKSEFSAPNRMSNVILKIGDDKLHVFKEILALHSPVFETLFGDSAEKGKEEVELKDVVYEEFVDLLNLLYVRTREITDRSVFHLLKLADQFHMEVQVFLVEGEILDQSKKYVLQSVGIDVVTKMMLADQYRIVELRDRCLQSFSVATDLTRKLKSSPQYANFSDGMKGAIYDRIIELTDAN